jgi:hypothetical protein
VQRLRDLAEEWFEMCEDIHEPLYEAAERIEAQAAEIAILRQPQTDVLKKARGAINGLLDIASEENLDSEQAGRAYAALHEIGTALAALDALGFEIREKGQ